MKPVEEIIIIAQLQYYSTIDILFTIAASGENPVQSTAQ